MCSSYHGPSRSPAGRPAAARMAATNGPYMVSLSSSAGGGSSAARRMPATALLPAPGGAATTQAGAGPPISRPGQGGPRRMAGFPGRAALAARRALRPGERSCVQLGSVKREDALQVGGGDGDTAAAAAVPAAGELGQVGGQRGAAVVVERFECLEGRPVPAAVV